jgi:hypothetical protein
MVVRPLRFASAVQPLLLDYSMLGQLPAAT